MVSDREREGQQDILCRFPLAEGLCEMPNGRQENVRDEMRDKIRTQLG